MVGLSVEGSSDHDIKRTLCDWISQLVCLQHESDLVNRLHVIWQLFKIDEMQAKFLHHIPDCKRMCAHRLQGSQCDISFSSHNGNRDNHRSAEHSIAESLVRARDVVVTNSNFAQNLVVDWAQDVVCDADLLLEAMLQPNVETAISEVFENLKRKPLCVKPFVEEQLHQSLLVL